MDVARFKQLPVMGILRGVESESIVPLSETIISSGLKTVEITMNTSGAPELIQQMVRHSSGQFDVGAGTVLNMDDLKQALDAGATFIVSPTLVSDVIEYCRENSIPVFPGALTPQEIYSAWQAGATMVKVFPSKFFGPTYFKEIKGPFQDIELLACGGVTLENIEMFFSCGASAIAFGGSIFKKDWLRDRNFVAIEKAIKALSAKVKGK